MENHNYTISYTGELFTTSLHQKSGTEIITDAPVDNNGKGSKFSPTDLLASSLVSCMMTVLAIDYQSRGISLHPFLARVKKIMLSSPRRVGEIQIAFDFGLNIWNEDELRRVERIMLNCPVANSLSKEITVTTNLKSLLNAT